LVAHLEPVEEGPPDRLALAVVVVEQVRRELLARVDQLRAQCRTLDLARRELTRLLRVRLREGTELRDRVGAKLERPVAQGAGRDAVLAVVLVDLPEQRVVVRLHPLLERDDRRTALLDLRTPLEVEKRFHLLEPEPAARRAEPVANDLQQVDE